MTDDEFRENTARTIRNMRDSMGLSKAKFAAIADVDGKSVSNWEDGTSVPNILHIRRMLTASGESAHRFTANVLGQMPMVEFTPDADVESKKSTLSDYILEAPDWIVHQLYFLVFGMHSGSWEAMIQKMVADAHTPIEGRYLSTKLIRDLYKMNAAHGALLNPDAPRPDMELLNKAIRAAAEAISNGENAYSIE